MDKLILPLDSPDVTLARAGGKGANLSRLMRGGLAVPHGYVVTTAAYDAFVAANDLGERIVALASALPAGDAAAAEATSASIRQLFEAATLPPALAAPIVAAYRALAAEADAAVAVRSSATAEDLPEASFAGQQDTLLNVRGEAALLAAVKRCWASLWTARALAYRARQGIAPADVALAVVVQRLVPADVAGIMFTADPLSGEPGRVVINAAWGLGEAIVGGQVNPDTVVVDRATGAIVEQVVAEKSIMTARTADGTAEVAVPAERRAAAALTPPQAAELARVGAAIEALFGAPQDIEWAIAEERVWVLQARPITTLPKVAGGLDAAVPGDDAWPAPGEGAPQPFDRWTQADMAERWPEPIAPLTWSLQPALTRDYSLYSFRDVRAPWLREIQWVKRAYGRVYMNEGAMAHVCREVYGMPLSMMGDAMGSGLADADERMDNGRMLRALPGMVPVLVERWRNEGRFLRHFPRIDRWVADFQARDLDALDDRALWDELSRVWQPRLAHAIKLHADGTATAMMMLPMLERFTERQFGRKELARELVTGLADLRQAEMVPALWRMARYLRELGLAGLVIDQPAAEALAALRVRSDAAPFLAQLDAFLAEHGHRCASEAEFLQPRWAEAPEQVLDTLAGYLRAGKSIDPLAAEARQRERRAAALADAEARLDPLRRAIFRGLLRRTEHLVRLRDNGQHYLTKLVLPMRRLFAALGAHWAARGWLEQPDDVFFLGIGEVQQLATGGDPAALGRPPRELVAARRLAHRHWFGVRAPEVLDAAGRPVAAPPPDAGDALAGIAASAGQVEGVARVVTTLAEATRLQPGEILVTRATDPGWTPVFPLIGGLVLEIGGQLSHGAIVAREYGLPAVVNVPDATTRIADGQRIRLDGAAGRVYLLDAPTTPAAAPAACLTA